MALSRAWWARSEHPFARLARGARRAVLNFTLPVPHFTARAFVTAGVVLRECYYFAWRVLVCEPWLKGYLTRYGRRVRTGAFLHWVMGRGEFVVGDDVVIDGKCSFVFAARYTDLPALRIGSHTVIGHNCTFTVGREITVGSHCLIAGDVSMFDSPGHPKNPERRKQGMPADLADVRPVKIGDNVWIGARSIIFPGVEIGDNSVVSMGSVVTSNVPPNSIVAGNPARVIGAVTEKPAENVALAAAAPAASGATAVERVASLDRVMDVVRKVLRDGSLGPDDDIYDAGMTSIMVLPLLVEMERAFGVSLNDGEFRTARTGRELVEILETLLSRSA